MRVIARSTLLGFWHNHPEARVPLERWYTLVSAAHWNSTDEVRKAVPKAKVLNNERVGFEIAGGNYRLVAAFDFRRQIVFVNFSALTLSTTAPMRRPYRNFDGHNHGYSAHS